MGATAQAQAPLTVFILFLILECLRTRQIHAKAARATRQADQLLSQACQWWTFAALCCRAHTHRCM